MPVGRGRSRSISGVALVVRRGRSRVPRTRRCSPRGAPLPFCRPITRSCSRRVVRSQCFDPHPDPAGHQIGAAGQPVRAVAVGHPHLLVQHVGVLGLDVVGSVLEPEQVSRGGLLAGGRRGTAEAELRIPHRDGAEARRGRGCGWRARRPAGRWRRPARRCRRRCGRGPWSRWGTSAGPSAVPVCGRRCRTGRCRP